MSIVTIVGASGVAVQVSVDGGAASRFVHSFQSAVASALGSGTLTSFYAAPGSNGTNATSGMVEAAISVGGAYTLNGDINAVAIGSPTTAGASALNTAVTVNAGGSTASSFSLVDGNMGSTDIVLGSQSGTIVTAQGHNTIDASTSAGSWTFVTGESSANAIELGSGSSNVISEGRDTISGTTGVDSVTLLGGSSTVTLGSGAAVIDGASSDLISVGDKSTVFGGFGSTVGFTGATGTLVGALGDTISAAGDLQVIHGTGNDITASGNLSFLNGTGTTTISAGAATIFGAAGLNAIVSTTSDTALFVANDGNETINGASSAQSLHAFAGTGNDTIIGGSAADTIVGGTGSATLTGGSGASNLFAITDGSAGGDYTITDFGSAAGNIMALYGYGLQNSSGLQSVLDSATVAGGNTTIALADGSKITFVGVSDLKATDFNLS